MLFAPSIVGFLVFKFSKVGTCKGSSLNRRLPSWNHNFSPWLLRYCCCYYYCCYYLLYHYRYNTRLATEIS